MKHVWPQVRDGLVAQVPGPVRALRVSPDGRFAVALDGGGDVWVIQLVSGAAACRGTRGVRVFAVTSALLLALAGDELVSYHLSAGRESGRQSGFAAAAGLTVGELGAWLLVRWPGRVELRRTLTGHAVAERTVDASAAAFEAGDGQIALVEGGRVVGLEVPSLQPAWERTVGDEVTDLGLGGWVSTPAGLRRWRDGGWQVGPALPAARLCLSGEGALAWTGELLLDLRGGAEIVASVTAAAVHPGGRQVLLGDWEGRVVVRPWPIGG